MRSVSVPTCYLCGGPGTVVYRDLRDHQFGVDGVWSIRKCSAANCGLRWLDPRPLDEDLHHAYRNYYTHAPAADTRRGLRSRLRAVARQLERSWLRVLGLAGARKDIDTLFLRGLAPGRLLDVGCGDGERLAMFRSLGWEVEGQEVDATAARNARESHNVPVHLGSLAALELPTGTYDAVVMNHVLEHLSDPVAELRECRRILKPGGCFVAATPNPDSLGIRRFEESWIGLEPPRHLFLFTPVAASGLAAAAGFDNYGSFTSAARSGGLLAASRELQRRGAYTKRGPISLTTVLSAMWYQLIARAEFGKDSGTGDETVLRAFR